MRAVRSTLTTLAVALLATCALVGCTNLLPAAEERAARIADDARAIGLTEVAVEARIGDLTPVPTITFSATGDGRVDRTALAEFMADVNSSSTSVGPFELALTDAGGATRDVRMHTGTPMTAHSIAAVVDHAESLPSTELTVFGGDGERAAFELADSATSDDAAVVWLRDAAAALPADADLDASSLIAGESGHSLGRFLVSAADADDQIGDIERVRAAVAAAASGEMPGVRLFCPRMPGGERECSVRVELEQLDDPAVADRVADALFGLELSRDDYRRIVEVDGRPHAMFPDATST